MAVAGREADVRYRAPSQCLLLAALSHSRTTAFDPEPPDEHPKNSHCGEEKRTVQGLYYLPRPPQGIQQIVT
jgi:hypothetical protein